MSGTQLMCYLLLFGVYVQEELRIDLLFTGIISAWKYVFKNPQLFPSNSIKNQSAVWWSVEDSLQK